jgi:anti-sigma B factor antagonist
MPQETLQMEEIKGNRDGVQVLQLKGPLVLATIFGFQATVRADTSKALILDCTNVPLVISAGIGALVGAYVSRERDGRKLGLVAVNQRIQNALEVTRVQGFFKMYHSVSEAEAALG